MGALICVTKMVKNNTQLWLMDMFKKSTNACVKNVVSQISELSEEFPQTFEDYFVSNCHGQVAVTISSVHGGYQNN